MDFLKVYQTDPAAAEMVVNYFNSYREFQRPGHTMGADGKTIKDTERKDSTDLAILDIAHPDLQPWLKELWSAMDRYIEDFPAAIDYAYGNWGLREPAQIQHYAPGQGYKAWHTERAGYGMYKYRHLVFMTYLNTIPYGCGGGTEFLHQRRVLDCKIGATAIWPADWTYVHRGVVSQTHEKYIITGWFSFDE